MGPIWSSYCYAGSSQNWRTAQCHCLRCGEPQLLTRPLTNPLSQERMGLEEEIGVSQEVLMELEWSGDDERKMDHQCCCCYCCCWCDGHAQAEISIRLTGAASKVSHSPNRKADSTRRNWFFHLDGQEWSNWMVKVIYCRPQFRVSSRCWLMLTSMVTRTISTCIV